jgi:hypothetical protein
MNASFEKAMREHLASMSLEFTVFGAIAGFALGAAATLIVQAVLA